jgi:hypothetical protein
VRAAISAVFIGFNMIPMILCVFLNEQGAAPALA